MGEQIPEEPSDEIEETASPGGSPADAPRSTSGGTTVTVVVSSAAAGVERARDHAPASPPEPVPRTNRRTTPAARAERRTSRGAVPGAHLRPSRAGTSRLKPGRRLAGFLALTGAAILLLIVLVRLLPSSAAQPATLPPRHVSQPAPVPTAPAATGSAVEVTPRVLGAGIGLLAPQEAVAMSNGTFAIADTGHRRLVILDAAGHLTRSITAGAGPLEQPYALAAGTHSLYLLDGQRGAIEQFNDSGRFEREVARLPVLIDSRGMAVDRAGNLYVANPRTNSIIVLSPEGKIERELSSPLGSAPDQLNQPSDVGIGSNGTIYVLDNVNNRLKETRPNGTFIRSWHVPPSSTLFSVHVMPLQDGRTLASDPAGFLLLFPAGGAPAQRLRLTIPGQGAVGVSPLGLFPLPHDKVLVTDHAGNRLLIVTLPPR